MITKKVKITQTIEVTIDETKLNQDFMDGFASYMFDFDRDEHIKHLAQMHAKGLADRPSTFVEGYGPLKDMGIQLRQVSQTEEMDP